MKQYLARMRDIYENGHDHADRTGKGRRSIFGTMDKYDISDGTLPVVTTRLIHLKSIVEELIWFIGGKTDNKLLNDKGVNIWNKWAVAKEDIEAFAEKYCEGDEEVKASIILHYNDTKLNQIGPMYGAMWRNAPQSMIHKLWPDVPMDEYPSDKLDHWKKEYEELKFINQGQDVAPFEMFCKVQYYTVCDQLNELVRNLKARPYSSRHVVNAWIPQYVPFEELSPKENVLMERGALAACHPMFQCFVTPSKVEGGKQRLSLLMFQRSDDYPVGANYNIAQYSLLLAMLAHVTDMEPYEFIHTNGDCHIYLDQLEFIEEQLSREPLPLPKLWLNPEVKDLFKFTSDDIRIEGYHSHPKINYPVAV